MRLEQYNIALWKESKKGFFYSQFDKLDWFLFVKKKIQYGQHYTAQVSSKLGAWPMLGVYKPAVLLKTQTWSFHGSFPANSISKIQAQGELATNFSLVLKVNVAKNLPLNCQLRTACCIADIFLLCVRIKFFHSFFSIKAFLNKALISQRYLYWEFESMLSNNQMLKT